MLASQPFVLFLVGEKYMPNAKHTLNLRPYAVVYSPKYKIFVKTRNRKDTEFIMKSHFEQNGIRMKLIEIPQDESSWVDYVSKWANFYRMVEE